MTRDERASLEKFMDCYNGLMKDEIRKVVGLDIDAIHLMVLPGGALRTSVFDNEMAGVSMVKPEGFFRRACRACFPSRR